MAEKIRTDLSLDEIAEEACVFVYNRAVHKLPQSKRLETINANLESKSGEEKAYVKAKLEEFVQATFRCCRTEKQKKK